MIFETERLLVRPFEPRDLEDFMVYRNNLEWMKYQGFKGLGRQDYETALLSEGSLETGLQLAIILKLADQLMGDLYLKRTGQDAWAGCTIDPRYARAGLAYEAMEGLCSKLTSEQVNYLYASVMPENEASIGLLKKLQFQFVQWDDLGDEVYRLELTKAKLDPL